MFLQWVESPTPFPLLGFKQLSSALSSSVGCSDATLPGCFNVGTVIHHMSPGWMAGAGKGPMQSSKLYSCAALWNLSLRLTALLTAGRVTDQHRGGTCPLLHAEVL